MNAWQNFTLHPKTTAAGFLLAILTIAPVLAKQGITLGAVGNGNWVSLIAGLATAILGILARDPQSL